MQRANVVGSGANGLAAAITLAQHGVAVTVYERNSFVGGACSSAEVTLPGYRHDLGSSVYPLGIVSPFFRSLPLGDFGLRWIEPAAPVVHPFDDGTVATLEHTVENTAAQFSPHDVRSWKRLFDSMAKSWPKLVSDFTHPLLRFPSHPVTMAAFGLPALLPADTLARMVFRDEPTRALFAGIAAHSVLPLSRVASSATGLVLALAGQTTGWPIAAGGAQSISGALAAYFESLGGKILLGHHVEDIRDLPVVDATFFDTSVKALTRIAGSKLSEGFVQRLAGFLPGPGIFKIDYALSSPIPWSAPSCLRAATVHIGGSLQEIAQSEHDAFYGRHTGKPFVLLVQPSIFDPTRAPDGFHTAWAYCHVPTGSTLDRTEAIENQITRFAPDFRDTVLARRTSNAEELAAWNPNLVGGDISGGAMTLTQLIARPTLQGYRTSNPAIFLCSSSTPPGGGVHGMCGHLAAKLALNEMSRGV